MTYDILNQLMKSNFMAGFPPCTRPSLSLESGGGGASLLGWDHSSDHFRTFHSAEVHTISLRALRIAVFTNAIRNSVQEYGHVEKHGTRTAGTHRRPAEEGRTKSLRVIQYSCALKASIGPLNPSAYDVTEWRALISSIKLLAQALSGHF